MKLKARAGRPPPAPRQSVTVWSSERKANDCIGYRHNIVELYLSEQPHGNRASEAVAATGARVRRQSDAVSAARPADVDVAIDSNPFFTFDNAVCISCARCVRACDEIQGTHALTMIGRGFSARPVAGAAALHGDAARLCHFQLRVLRSLREGMSDRRADGKDRARAGAQLETVRTTCAYCGVGCAFDAGVRDGKVVKMVPADDGPSNQGHACMKGRFGWTYNDAPDRLRVPLLRRRGTIGKKFPGTAALDRIAQEFDRGSSETHGPDALATISSSRGTNEENYLFGKFMRCVIGTQPYRQLRPRLPQRDRDRHDGNDRGVGCDQFHSGL